jgi:hypothetical protein
MCPRSKNRRNATLSNPRAVGSIFDFEKVLPAYFLIGHVPCPPGAGPKLPMGEGRPRFGPALLGTMPAVPQTGLRGDLALGVFCVGHGEGSERVE